jgi:hypothetical protein
MNASELRIGNYVHGNPYDGVIRIFNNGKCVIKHKSGIEKCEIKNLQPIPLNKEWLLNFGFEEYAISYYKLGEVYIYYANTGLHEYRLREFNIIIKHVHKLQNLYFALTGEELILNI